MSRTPPRLRASFSNRPLSKINVRIEQRRPEMGSREHTIPALMFGRALDAVARGDSDFFSEETSALISLADALADVLKASGRHELPEISVAIDRIRKLLATDQSSVLSNALLSRVGPDAGLDDLTACHVLTHAALEAYYLHGASAAARHALQETRELIRLATGTSVELTQPEHKLEVGLEVWEAWQGIQALDPCFGLRAFAAEMEQRGAHAAAGLALGAEVLMRATVRKVDRDALSDSLAALERFARDHGRHSDHAITAIELGAVAPNRVPPLMPEPLDWDGDDTLPDFRPHLALPLDMRNVMTATPTERRELARTARRKQREVPLIVDDLLSVIERFDILMNGDENRLVYELAPMLQHSLRVLYGELELFHPQVEASIYSMPGAPEPLGGSAPLFSDHERDVNALRVLVSKAVDLDRRLKEHGETQLDLLNPESNMRGRADALLVVLRARGIVISDTERTLVLSCADGQVINRWLERAAVSRTSDEVFRA